MQRRLTLGLALALIGISIAANLWRVLGRMWPTDLFLLVGLLGGILLLFWLLARLFAASYFARHVGELSVFLVVASALTFALGSGVRHRETHMLTWSYDAPRRVRLRFATYPNFSMVVDSQRFADCLERQHRHDLAGVFEVTTDFGKVRAVRDLSVGPCQVPPEAWSYAETRDSGPSPW